MILAKKDGELAFCNRSTKKIIEKSIGIDKSSKDILECKVFSSFKMNSEKFMDKLLIEANNEDNNNVSDDVQ